MADEIDLLRRFIEEIPGPSTDAWARARAAIGAARSEEEPSGHRSRLRLGRRRLLAITAGVATAAAAGLLAGVLPGSPGPVGRQQIRTTAYVTGVERALASPRQDGLVGYTRTVYPPGTVTGPTGELSAGPEASSPWRVGSTVTWAFQDTLKTSAFTPAGQPVFTERATHVSGRTETVTVIYPNATWWRATAGAPAGRTPACPPVLTPGLPAIARWAPFIRDELRCGGYRVDGRQRVDGIDAVKLTGGKALVALWVNPATYLPVRAISRFGRGQAQTEFRWLSPAPASQSGLRMRVPAGFRQIPPPS
jgi:hypothetical protein